MAEEKKSEPEIERHYQVRAKKFVDTLFDLALLSESLSRDGMTALEDLVALHFQQIGESSSKVAGFSKKYKAGASKPEIERHEEEMAWIARAREAEIELEKVIRLKGWASDVVNFFRAILKKPAVPFPYQADARAATLLQVAFEIGIAEPDLKPGQPE